MSGQGSSSCKAKMEGMCTSPGDFGRWYAVNYDYILAPAYGIKAANSALDVAYFLATRAPHAWIAGGTMLGWHMSHWWTANKTRPINFRQDLRPPEFEKDYGVPTNNCSETAAGSGIFVREWSKATVTVDCNTLAGHIVLKSPVIVLGGEGAKGSQ